MYDCIIKTTNSREECLEAIQGKCPDIVILDSDRPDYNGLDILREIYLRSKVPIFYISDMNIKSEKVKVLERE